MTAWSSCTSPVSLLIVCGLPHVSPSDSSEPLSLSVHLLLPIVVEPQSHIRQAPFFPFWIFSPAVLPRSPLSQCLHYPPLRHLGHCCYIYPANLANALHILGTFLRDTMYFLWSVCSAPMMQDCSSAWVWQERHSVSHITTTLVSPKWHVSCNFRCPSLKESKALGVYWRLPWSRAGTWREMEAHLLGLGLVSTFNAGRRQLSEK